MSSFVIVKSYDGTIVRVPMEKLNEYKARQAKILEMINSGKSIEEIKILIKEGAL